MAVAQVQRTDAPSRRPGGRSAEVLARIRSSVEGLIAEHGAESLTIPMLAKRAGVQPSSLYRRWGDIGSLLNELATYKLDPNRPLSLTGDFAADVRSWAAEIVAHYSIPENAAMLRAGAACAGTRESDCLRHRRAEAAAILEQARDAGDTTVEDLLNRVTAPIIYRVIFSPWDLDAGFVDGVVGNLVRVRVAVG
ncbi:MAG TPA: TetR/AcrR family transcriptional regulator [Pseudolysinimonas sp.]|nr:TetR/AcrR family transcriptional regulator [Pseudolysinimonas sp.]